MKKQQIGTPQSPRITKGVVAIVAVLFFLFLLLTLPALRRARESAKRTYCMSNLKQLGLALHMYAQDYGGRFPTVGSPRGEGGIESIELLWPKYVSDPSLFVCPSDEGVTPWGGNGRLNASHCSYGYDHSHSSTDPTGVAIMADYTGVDQSPDGLPTCHYHPSGSGFFVLFLDHRVTWRMTRYVGLLADGQEQRDDIFAKSRVLPPEEDSWISR